MGREGLLNRFFMTNIADAAKEKPQELADALLRVWAHDPSEVDLDAFAGRMCGVLGRLTPGNATAMASVLLMVRDTSDYPPYVPTAAATVRRLSEGAESEPASPANRYHNFLPWLDRFIEEADERGFTIANRLSAQGLAWTVAKTDPAATAMPADLVRDFLRWRGDGPEPQRAWLMRPAQGGPGRWAEEGFVSLPARSARRLGRHGRVDGSCSAVAEPSRPTGQHPRNYAGAGWFAGGHHLG